MYDLVPTKELAMESISCPLTPKSQSLISPREFTRMLEGLTSVKREQEMRELTLVIWERRSVLYRPHMSPLQAILDLRTPDTVDKRCLLFESADPVI